MSLIQKTALKSGINVITEEMPDVESATIGVWVNTGSRNESPEVSGISHFIEHLLFKGTLKRTSLDISREIESVGGVLNAFTSREYTCFYAKVLSNDLPLAIDLLSDIFMNSKFDKSELDRERMVVFQEIKMVEDTPDDLVHDLFAANFWQSHPLGRSILGTRKSVGELTRAQITKYFSEHYASNKVLITAAGKLKHRTVVRALNKTFGHVKSRPPKEDAGMPVSTPGLKLYKKSLEQTHLCLGMPCPEQPSPDRYKTYLLNTILGGGMSSRLFQQIREKRGLAYSVYSYLNLCRDTGSLVAYAGTSKESFGEVVALMLKEFEKFRKKGVTPTELDNAKEQLKGGMLLGLETSDNRMSKLARDEIYFNHFVPVKDIVKCIDRVTVEDIRAMAETLFVPEKMTLVAIGKVAPEQLPEGLFQ
ncbi:MAG: zinc protease [Deltaproteobacteria bacterium RBG_19FT_COMBO_58_16]|nr:MAG: zinc protease [Deltaproteobacteria bacterium RBG_19FT_COMBO_58_16]